MMTRTLEEWYRRINGIYFDRNFYRSVESIFCHLLEVGRGLGIASDPNRKRNLNSEDYLPKTLAWWFALCGRVGVPSVEDMLWAKFPYVCPYCRLCPHLGEECKERRSDRSQVDWDALKDIAAKNQSRRPSTIKQWQKMFGTLYRRDENTGHIKNIARLAEEFGELAEAIRVLPIAPQYFVSEAPDVFAWLMGFANQFDFDRRVPGETLEESMERNYPGACIICKFPVCKCPPIPAETLGRIAREAPIGQVFPGYEGLFTSAEALELFSNIEHSLKIGQATIKPTRTDVHQMAEDIRRILDELKKQNDIQPVFSVQLAATLGRLETLATQGAVTQDGIQTLLDQLKSLPSEKRGAAISFLTSISASALFQAILEAARFLPH
jgi:NTP pyrophosphatase (non-canonical NTP hydrolase)